MQSFSLTPSARRRFLRIGLLLTVTAIATFSQTDLLHTLFPLPPQGRPSRSSSQYGQFQWGYMPGATIPQFRYLGGYDLTFNGGDGKFLYFTAPADQRGFGFRTAGSPREKNETRVWQKVARVNTPNPTLIPIDSAPPGLKGGVDELGAEAVRKAQAGLPTKLLITDFILPDPNAAFSKGTVGEFFSWSYCTNCGSNKGFAFNLAAAQALMHGTDGTYIYVTPMSGGYGTIASIGHIEAHKPYKVDILGGVSEALCVPEGLVGGNTPPKETCKQP